jgi:hypothetical protein
MLIILILLDNLILKIKNSYNYKNIIIKRY